MAGFTTVTFADSGVADGGPMVSARAGELRLTVTMFGFVIKIDGPYLLYQFHFFRLRFR